MCHKSLQVVNDEVKNCKKCPLWKTRKNAVPGEGCEKADIIFIGEAPGRNEDIKGRPFVGRAGNIFEDLLTDVGLRRKDIYITNIVKCRPPKNRNPLKSEIKTCTPYLDRQLNILEPKLIVPLGSFASSFIFEKYGKKFEKISYIHGKKFTINTIEGNLDIVPMYHPAVATYNPNKKEVLLKDFKKIKELID